MKPKFTTEEAALVNKVAAMFGYLEATPEYYEESEDMCGEEMKFSNTLEGGMFDIVVFKLKQVGYEQTWVVSLHECCGSENYWLDDGLNEKDLKHVFEYYIGEPCNNFG